MEIYALQLAGFILLCIVTANFFAPKRMRWIENLDKTEPIFRQVFIIHCIYLIGCVFGMAAVCLLLPYQLLNETMGRVILAFMAFFWGTRVFVQLFYYEKSIKKLYPFFNFIFTVAFIYLALCFTVLSFIR